MVNQRQRLIGLLGLMRDIDVVIRDLSGKTAREHLAALWRERGTPYLEELQKGRLLDPLEEEYAVLGLVPCANDEVVRAAYKAMMKQHHPDIEGGDEEIAKKLNEAYEKICIARGMA